MGATFDPGGAPTATRMLGGFILVALFLCFMLAWPGRRRWPIWLIGGLSVSVSAALALSLLPAGGWWFVSLRSAWLAIAAGFTGAAALIELRKPLN